jgi:hypothetical protein
MDNFNAVSIERTLARFFGKEPGERGTFFDADVFRSGIPEDLAKIVGNVADTLEARIETIRFPGRQPGSAKSQVDGCVAWLRRLQEQIRQRSAVEREEYHWEIFGAVMMGITGLLETLEAQVTVH